MGRAAIVGIGEEQTTNLIELVKVSNSVMGNDLTEIIMNNEELNMKVRNRAYSNMLLLRLLEQFPLLQRFLKI